MEKNNDTKKIGLYSFATAVVLSLAGCNHTQHKAVSVDILHTNDHHSYLEGQTYSLKLDYDKTVAGAEDVRLNLGGFSRIANAINTYRDSNTIVLNSGELNGTLYFSLFKGEADFKVFNYLGIDAYELGNHEFDEGDAHLADLISMANFPIIAANVHPTSASPLYGSNIQPYVIKEIDGEKVGIIGVLKVEKTKESSMVSDDVDFDDEIESVRENVATLKAQNINKIIVLSHLGYDFDQTLGKSVTDVDIIIGGDTHNVLDSTGEIASMGVTVDGQYPTVVNNPDGEPVYIAQAWEYAKGIGRMNIDFDKNGIVTNIGGHLELLVGEPYQVRNAQNQWVDANDTQKAAIRTEIYAKTTIKEMQTDPNVENIIKPYKDEIENYTSQVLGTVSETMPFTRIPTDFSTGQTPTGSYAAYVVAEAFLNYLPKADVAIQNAGGVRAELKEGDFTAGDAYTILPFSNTVVTIDMKGSEIVKVLNEALTYAQGPSGSTGAVPYSSHLRYDVVLGAPAQQGILNVEIKDKDTGVWSPIDMNATYSVATNSFTALGKDGYVTFEDVRTANPDAFEESDVAYAIPLIEYFRDYLPSNTLGTINFEDYCFKSVSTISVP